MTQTKIIITDDHPIIRKGLRQIIKESTDSLVVDEASSGSELQNKLKHKSCDLIILDISMPGETGLQVIRMVKKSYPNIRILVLSIHPEEQYAIQAIKAGASGYLNKESAPELLVSAIKIIETNGRYISAKVAELLASRLNDMDCGLDHTCLSERETYVLLRIAIGKSMSEIAAELKVSIKTVSTYRRRILDKMNFRTNAELIKYAIKNNLVSISH